MAARGKVCALRAPKLDQEAVGRESNERNPETGAAGKKNEKNSDALDTGGGHAVTIGDIPSLERFQIHPNGKSRWNHLPPFTPCSRAVNMRSVQTTTSGHPQRERTSSAG